MARSEEHEEETMGFWTCVLILVVVILIAAKLEKISLTQQAITGAAQSGPFAVLHSLATGSLVTNGSLEPY